MMSLWDALRMNMMISYQELVRTFPSAVRAVNFEVDMSGIITLVIALILLVAAVYNLISYIRDRRSASLPSKKTKR
ncbi:hypothetical protein C5Y17_021245 [Klebsiella pneumoniae subsp. pneumoniae]|nr:hypothetical protein DZ696_21765 [Klebsiella pneumoniae]RNX37470.1 hypothetical protein C5Y17_021245 [Klebsiella pneumoniae subsp. pneumoniae]RNT82522.1 hypothetical protein B9469_006115 [Klebsiella pneumoniae]RNX46583.1 hypothetical protein C5Y18_003220 [Klebsiella pneumoniae subsp. pneumoniae]ROA04328.1 hypothetical protein C5X69_005370 [Klebsiella pneumoniae subsp. pneumoniae]